MPTWEFGEVRWTWPADSLPRLPRLMGIVNATPDSFSDGGHYRDAGRVADRALELFEAGADIVDIGGESTRPGAEPISPGEESHRVIPVIERLCRQTRAPVSIDTTKAEVAMRAFDAGAVIVNDISGLTFDPSMASFCAQARAGVVCMHIQGTPQTMQHNPQYADVVAEVRDWLCHRLESLEQAGIGRERVILDPGIGFGKTSAHNLAILQNVAAFRELGRPVLVGHSRKGFLRKLLGRDVDERLAGTIGVAAALALQGVDLLRVHDVRAVRDAIAALFAVLPDGLRGECDPPRIPGP